MPDAKHDGIALSPAAVEAVAGLSAGAMATLVVHPLDVVKTRMQIHRSINAAASGAASASPLISSSSPRPPPSALGLLRDLATTPGRPLAALYRGLAPNLLGSATSWAAFFFFKARAESAIAARRTKHQPPHASPSLPTPLTPADYFVASALAGAATQLLTNPIWVLKTRMLSSDAAAAGAYPSMAAGARAVLRAEGVRGFYRGLAVGLLGVAHGAVQFAVYEPAKGLYLAWRQQEQQRQRRQRGNDGQRGGEETAPPRVGAAATLALATLSKLAAGLATYPLQVLRSRLQNYDAEARFGRGIGGTAARLWREEGWRGFYRGLVPGSLRVLPATWVTFLVYENVKYALPRALAEM